MVQVSSTPHFLDIQDLNISAVDESAKHSNPIAAQFQINSKNHDVCWHQKPLSLYVGLYMTKLALNKKLGWG
jgi:hypothetical protein